jgi:hypothetical protein
MPRYTVAAALGALVLGASLALAPTAWAANTKMSFNDVVLPDGQIGEIEASARIMRNKSDSITCAYFTDDYKESLGYYFNFVEPAPTDADGLLALCLARFDFRNT